MVLVNGAAGIGTGFSTSIPQYNPLHIAANLKRRIRGEPMEPMMPWYRGFRGEIRDQPKGTGWSGVCWVEVRWTGLEWSGVAWGRVE